ncbi:MAG TPA: glycosyltransferase family 87 protein, partial [Blastocatellia bacterium]|nr:glycosyltransferase family 87 protein [Blastocatellia bacterium]
MTIGKQRAKPGYSVIIITGIAFSAVWFGYRAVQLAGTDAHTYHIDYNVFYMAWQSVLHTGGNPYAEQISPATPYLYPPLFAQLFSPLGLLSVQAAAGVWYAIGILALAASLLISERLVFTDTKHKINFALIALSFVAIARFGLDNLRMGQINLLVVAVVLLALYLFEKNRIWPAAIVLATAISFKLTPALFLIYFLAKREWRFVFKTSAIAGSLNVASFVPMGRNAP